jgi:hypothetical protein
MQNPTPIPKQQFRFIEQTMSVVWAKSNTTAVYVYRLFQGRTNSMKNFSSSAHERLRVGKQSPCDERTYSSSSGTTLVRLPRIRFFSFRRRTFKKRLHTIPICPAHDQTSNKKGREGVVYYWWNRASIIFVRLCNPPRRAAGSAISKAAQLLGRLRGSTGSSNTARRMQVVHCFTVDRKLTRIVKFTG